MFGPYSEFWDTLEAIAMLILFSIGLRLFIFMIVKLVELIGGS